MTTQAQHHLPGMRHWSQQKRCLRESRCAHRPAVRLPALTQTLVMGRGRSTLLQPMRVRVQARQLLGGQRMSLTAPQIAAASEATKAEIPGEAGKEAASEPAGNAEVSLDTLTGSSPAVSGDQEEEGVVQKGAQQQLSTPVAETGVKEGMKSVAAVGSGEEDAGKGCIYCGWDQMVPRRAIRATRRHREGAGLWCGGPVWNRACSRQ